VGKELEKIEGKDKDNIVKIVDGGLHFIFSLTLFLFLFFFYFLFSIFRTTWVRVYQSRCHKSMA